MQKLPVPEGPHSRLLQLQRFHLHGPVLAHARTHPRGSPSVLPAAPLPPVRTSRAAPPAPLPPSLRHPSPADSSGVPGQRRERRAGEMETETHQGPRQREEERERFRVPGSPELGISDSCGEKA